jgi:hypothetical protein
MGGAHAARLTWAQVRAFRLARQRLDEPDAAVTDCPELALSWA